MFKLKPVAQAIFEGFLQRIVSITPQGFTPYLAGFLNNTGLFPSGTIAPWGEIDLINTEQINFSITSRRFTATQADWPLLADRQGAVASLFYVQHMGLRARSFEDFYNSDRIISALRGTPVEENNLYESHGIRVNYTANAALRLAMLYDPRQRLTALYSFDFPVSLAATFDPSSDIRNDGESSSRYRGSISIRLRYSQSDAQGFSRDAVSPTTHPLSVGSLYPRNNKTPIFWLRHNPSGRQYRARPQGNVAQTLDNVYVGGATGQINLACTLGTIDNLEVEPGVLRDIADITEFSVVLDFVCTSQTDPYLTPYNYSFPSALTSGGSDFFTTLYEQRSDGLYYPDGGVDRSTTIIEATGFIPNTGNPDLAAELRLELFNRQRAIYDAITQDTVTYTTIDDYNDLGVMGGGSMTGNAQVTALFQAEGHPFDNPAINPRTPQGITYNISSVNNAGLEGHYWMVARRSGVWSLECVGRSGFLSGSFDGTPTEQYNGVYGQYVAFPRGNTIPLSFFTPRNGHRIAGFRLEYDLDNETLSNNIYSAPVTLHGTIENASGLVVDEVVLARFPQMTHGRLNPSNGFQPVRSLGYNALIRQGISEETQVALLDDLELRQLSASNSEHVYADVGVFLVENVTALPTVPTIPAP